MEAQSESASGADSALADMLLMGGAVEVLVTPGSTFGYVVHGLSGGRATLYGGTHTSRELVGPKAGDCTAVRTSEPNFHFLKVRAVQLKPKASQRADRSHPFFLPSARDTRLQELQAGRGGGDQAGQRDL